MSSFDLSASLERAQERLKRAAKAGGRRPRSDRGTSRIDARTLAVLVEACGGYEQPGMSELLARVGETCRGMGLAPPSRASVYKLWATLPTPRYQVAGLSPSVRDALYNLTDDSEVPAHQVAFYCFNYGDLAAASFAAGLPWLALYQAARMPGYRSKSRGLIEAVMRARGLA
jgi:hypothetical protein